jgi:hypothetical protein
MSLWWARPGGGQPCPRKAFRHPQPVEFQPGVFPGKLLIGDIGGYLVGEQEKALAALDLVFVGFAFGGLRVEPARAGQAQVEEIVVSGSRAIGMGRVALLPAELIESKVNKILAWKDGKNYLAHKIPLCVILYYMS